jgi:hypothetical protein
MYFKKPISSALSKQFGTCTVNILFTSSFNNVIEVLVIITLYGKFY